MQGAPRAQFREVKQLRDLLRDRSARDADGVFVIDGPRAVDGAFDRNAVVRHLYVGEDANASAVDVLGRAVERGVPVTMLERGVAQRISDVRTSPGVFALCDLARATLADLEVGSLWVVIPAINDPGNLGTIIRAAEAAGASGIALGRPSVDVYNPKVVRASAGAVFTVPIVEGDAHQMLDALGARGVTRYAATSNDSPDDPGLSLLRCNDADLRHDVALVLGHETRGLQPLPYDHGITIPMTAVTESLNVAMAATVLLFEVARQRNYGATGALAEGAM